MKYIEQQASGVWDTLLDSELKSRIWNVRPSISITSLTFDLWSWPYQRWLSSNMKISTACETLLQPIWRPVSLLDPHLLAAHKWFGCNNNGVITIWDHCSSFSKAFLQPSKQADLLSGLKQQPQPIHQPGLPPIILRFWIKRYHVRIYCYGASLSPSSGQWQYTMGFWSLRVFKMKIIYCS